MSTFLDALLSRVGLKRTPSDFVSFAHKPSPIGEDVLLLEDSEDDGEKKYSFLAELGLGGEGGGAVRDPQYWAESSNDDGTSSGVFDVLQSGAFVSQIGRINRWGGGGACSTQLPAVGPGDHNKVVGYYEGSGNPVATHPLEVTAQGSTDILSGWIFGTSRKLYGPGSFHLFRYDESLDKWIELTAVTSAGPELRRRMESLEGNEINFAVLDLSDPVNVALTAPTITTAWFIILAATYGAYAQLSSLNCPGDSDDPNFSPRKLLYNTTAVPVVLLLNQFEDSGGAGFACDTPGRSLITIQPGTGRWVQWNSGGGGWLVFDVPSALEICRPVTTVNLRASTGETVRADATASSVTITAPNADTRLGPQALYSGQSFGVKRMDADENAVIVDGDGNNVQDPANLTAAPVPAVGVASSSSARWYWDESVPAWMVAA